MVHCIVDCACCISCLSLRVTVVPLLWLIVVFLYCLLWCSLVCLVSPCVFIVALRVVYYGILLWCRVCIAWVWRCELAFLLCFLVVVPNVVLVSLSLGARFAHLGNGTLHFLLWCLVVVSCGYFCFAVRVVVSCGFLMVLLWCRVFRAASCCDVVLLGRLIFIIVMWFVVVSCVSSCGLLCVVVSWSLVFLIVGPCCCVRVVFSFGVLVVCIVSCGVFLVASCVYYYGSLMLCSCCDTRVAFLWCMLLLVVIVWCCCGVLNLVLRFLVMVSCVGSCWSFCRFLCVPYGFLVVYCVSRVVSGCVLIAVGCYSVRVVFLWCVVFLVWFIVVVVLMWCCCFLVVYSMLLWF